MTPRQALIRSSEYKKARELPLKARLAVPCPYCPVEVGDLCMTEDGRPISTPHAERTIAAWRARSAGFEVKVEVRQRDRVLRDPEALSFAQRAAGAKSLDKLRHECKIRKIATDALKGLSI